MYVECIKYTDRNGWMIPYIFPVQIRRGDVVKEERWDRGGRRPISTRRRKKERENQNRDNKEAIIGSAVVEIERVKPPLLFLFLSLSLIIAKIPPRESPSPP